MATHPSSIPSSHARDAGTHENLELAVDAVRQSNRSRRRCSQAQDEQASDQRKRRKKTSVDDAGVENTDQQRTRKTDRQGGKKQKFSDGTKVDGRKGRTWKRRDAGDRKWNEEGWDGSRTSHVKYTKLEDEKLLKAAEELAAEQGLTKDAFLELLKEKRDSGDSKRRDRIWCRLAGLADIPRRSVISQNKRLFRILDGNHGKWTSEELQSLVDMVAESPGVPSWKRVGARLGISARICRSKWRAALSASGEHVSKRGKWSDTEYWALRQGVLELTGELAPISMIPWRALLRYLPHRSEMQCFYHWHHRVLPRLLKYRDQCGVAIDADVLERQMLRKMRKFNFEDYDDVQWLWVNKFWPPNISIKHWKDMCRNYLPWTWRTGEEDEHSFIEIVDKLYHVMSCKEKKKMDRRTLKHAKLVLDSRAEELGDEEDDEKEEWL